MKQYGMGSRLAHEYESRAFKQPPPTPLVVGEGFMPSRKRAGINPAPTVGEGGGEGELSRGVLTGGIIAAGEGSRLKRDGLRMPKPMVPIAGVPLIERVVSNYVKVGITQLWIIFNEDDRECSTFIQERFPNLDIRCIVKTTRSSYESFWEVGGRAGSGLILMSTVDWICPEAAFLRFVDQARRCRQASVVLAVTPFVADEKPLWATLDPSGRVTGIGGNSGDVVTAGLYLVSGSVFAKAPHPSTLCRLRDFLTWMVDRGVPVHGVVIDQVIDVDRAEDLHLAEKFVRDHEWAPSDS